MEHTQLLRVKSLNKKDYGGNIIAVAARHNLDHEARAKDYIDPSRTHLNVILRGAVRAADVAAEAIKLMEAAGIKKPRSNASLGIEALISLRPSSGIAEQQFFIDAVACLEAFFEIPILSAVIHNDEAAPHCHIIMLPLFNGRMIGNQLLGDAARIKAMQGDFHAKVASRYGLSLPKPAKRHSAAARARIADSVIDAMRKALKGIDEPTFWDAMRDSITEKPEPLMAYFGIEYAILKQPEKTFTSIMIKNCPERKHKTAIVVQNKNAIAVEPVCNPITSPEKVQPLSCVVVAELPSLIQPSNTLQSSNQDEIVRVRDSEQAAIYWNGELGEYVKPPIRTKPKSAKIEDVLKGLATIDARKRSNEART
jgi:hypothetical protein